jgi:hypothetical protein
VLFFSLFVTIAVSSFIGVGGMYISNSFLGYFLIAFSVQFIGFFVLNTFLQKNDYHKETELANTQLEALSKYLIKLSCAYCSKPNTTPIVLNRENKFKCEFCQQFNGIKMQFFSTQITTPIERVILPTIEKDY